jgi:hypothetical protein
MNITAELGSFLTQLIRSGPDVEIDDFRGFPVGLSIQIFDYFC